MSAHSEEQFKIFLSQLRKTNQTLGFFCDFEKIENNVANIKLSLHMLNSLIGAEDLKNAVETIWKRDKSAFDVMDILIAVRREGKKYVLNSSGDCIQLNTLFQSVDGVVEFLFNTGLADLFRERKIQNLVDYVFGIETGLDTNARKNRSGHVMEGMVKDIFLKHSIPFRSEVYSKEWKAVRDALGNDEKRFDFVVESKDKTFLCEVNFYSGGGSKLNEVARAYSELAPRINALDGFEFVWITDGIGWKSAENKLHEAYNIIPRVYNLTNIVEFINEINKP